VHPTILLQGLGEELVEEASGDLTSVVCGRSHVVDRRDIGGERRSDRRDRDVAKCAAFECALGIPGANDGGRDASKSEADLMDRAVGDVRWGRGKEPWTRPRD